MADVDLAPALDDVIASAFAMTGVTAGPLTTLVDGVAKLGAKFTSWLRSSARTAVTDAASASVTAAAAAVAAAASMTRCCCSAASAVAAAADNSAMNCDDSPSKSG